MPRRGFFKTVTVIDADQSTAIGQLLTRVGLAETTLGNKADVSYVDSGLAGKLSSADIAGKADISYVDAGLAGKLSSADISNKADVTYVDSALASKADLSALDSKASVSYVDEQLALKANKPLADAMDQAINILVGPDGALSVEPYVGAGGTYVYDGTVQNIPVVETISTAGINAEYWSSSIGQRLIQSMDAGKIVNYEFDGPATVEIPLWLYSGERPADGAQRKIRNGNASSDLTIFSEGKNTHIIPAGQTRTLTYVFEANDWGIY